MKSIITRRTFLHGEEAEKMDLTELFSEEMSNGWDIETISTCLYTQESGRVIVVTALLAKD